MPLITQRYDDGSTDTYDSETGEIVAATDSTGSSVSVSPGGSAIARQAWDLLAYGVRGILDQKFRVQNAQTQVAVSQAQSRAQVSQLVPLLLLAGGGVLAYKVIKG